MGFQIGGNYENRRGTYTVLDINHRGMLVRYGDGTEERIKNIELQQRIVNNVRDDQSASYSDCLCRRSDETILDWLLDEALPDSALVNHCCWRRICQVRGRNYHMVDEESWSDLCARRGYILSRQNPRGF